MIQDTYDKYERWMYVLLLEKLKNMIDCQGKVDWIRNRNRFEHASIVQKTCERQILCEL